MGWLERAHPPPTHARAWAMGNRPTSSAGTVIDARHLADSSLHLQKFPPYGRKQRSRGGAANACHDAFALPSPSSWPSVDIRHKREGEGWVGGRPMQGVDEVFLALACACTAGEPPDAPYVERSAVPLHPPGWETFRRLGCFSREAVPLSQDAESRKVELGDGERDAAGCAAKCSSGSGLGVAFFGISDGKT